MENENIEPWKRSKYLYRVDMYEFVFKLLTPFFFVARSVIKVSVLGYVRFFRDTKVSVNSKCPACGYRVTHAIQFSEDYGRVVHVCTICKANWGVPPVLKYEQWAISRVIQKPKEE